jgi:hypothetical protein
LLITVTDYFLFDTEACETIKEGDRLNNITFTDYSNGEKEVSLDDVEIVEILSKKVVVETSSDRFTIEVEDIISWR